MDEGKRACLANSMSSTGAGIELAVRAPRAIIDPEELTLTLVTLTADLMDAL